MYYKIAAVSFCSMQNSNANVNMAFNFVNVMLRYVVTKIAKNEEFHTYVEQ